MVSKGPVAGCWPNKAAHQPYSFLLFGRFQARYALTDRVQLEGRRMQEILSYLLLFRQRAHQREVLAGTLWGSSTKAQSRKNLRQVLWQLQDRQRFNKQVTPQAPLLLVEREWVQVNAPMIWLDVAELESAFDLVSDTVGERMTQAQAHRVRESVALYRGDLLEGWPEDWCTYERERLRVVYLAMLEKLLGYCEATGTPQEGLVWGERLLRQDRAHERAHWRMMRLHHLAGDRTGALRQFERCRTALAEELGVKPGRLTTDLYEQIRADVPVLHSTAAGPG